MNFLWNWKIIAFSLGAFRKWCLYIVLVYFKCLSEHVTRHVLAEFPDFPFKLPNSRYLVGTKFFSLSLMKSDESRLIAKPITNTIVSQLNSEIIISVCFYQHKIHGNEAAVWRSRHNNDWITEESCFDFCRGKEIFSPAKCPDQLWGTGRLFRRG